MKTFKNTQSIIALSLLVVGIGIVVSTTLPEATKYYVTVDELLAQQKKYTSLNIKLAGRVVPKSIVEDKQTLTWTFKVMESAQEIPVRYQGAMPDTFKDEADVVLTGHYEDQAFVATEVLAKCASKYEEKLEAPLLGSDALSWVDTKRLNIKTYAPVWMLQGDRT